MSIGCKMRGLGESTYYTKSLKPQLDEIAGDNPYVIEHEVGKRRLRLKIDADANVIENLTTVVNQQTPKSNRVSMEWSDGLPMVYSRTDYLESTGTQYINSKIIANDYGDNLGFNGSFSWTNVSNTWATNVMIFGARKSSKVENIELSKYGGGMLRWGTEEKFYSFPLNKKITANLKNLRFSYAYDGSERGSFTYTGTQSLPNVPFVLFALNESGRIQYHAKYTKIYDLNFCYKDTKTRSFVPVIDATGAPCMFDLVTRRPFYNSGSGDFITEETKNLFYPVEYIESTDRKPYITIDDLNCSTDIGVEITYRQDEINTDSANPWIICGFGVASGTYPRPYIVVPGFRYSKLSEESSATTKVLGFYATYQNANDITGKAKYVVRDFVPGTYTASCNFYNDKKIIFDGTVLGDCDILNSNISSIKNIAIFGFGNGGSVYTPYNFKGKVYSVKITKGDTLVRDMVPALDYNGNPCLHDNITNKNYYNVGSGNFSYGSAISTYSLRNNDVQYAPEYAIKTTAGIRKLYHVPENYDGSIEDYVNEHNYKRLVEPECPNEEGKYYASQWNETDTELILEWIEVEPPVLEEQTPIEEI